MLEAAGSPGSPTWLKIFFLVFFVVALTIASVIGLRRAARSSKK
jgi:hypothetical protein